MEVINLEYWSVFLKRQSKVIKGMESWATRGEVETMFALEKWWGKGRKNSNLGRVRLRQDIFSLILPALPDLYWI
jgi:hypothetical protein